MLGRQFLAATILTSVPAWAWGPEGHEIIAEIARQELTPGAREQVAAILGSDAMLVHESNWADEIRSRRPETGPWHYVDIPLKAEGYDAARDCAQKNCAIAVILSAQQTLADKSAPVGARQGALRFLIHLVGDVHQPLHAEDNGDRGGNAIPVFWHGQRTNLHHVWDTTVLDGLGQDVETVAIKVEDSITPDQRKAWQAGTVIDWTNESHAVARDVIYPHVRSFAAADLPANYPRDMAPVTRTQLARAGVRLAYLLNALLK